MKRFSTFFLVVVMVAGGTTFAFAQQARYVFNPNFLNFGESRSGPIPRTVVSFQSNYAPGTIYIDTSERRLYLVMSQGQAIRYGIGVGRYGFEWRGAVSYTHLTLPTKREV